VLPKNFLSLHGGGGDVGQQLSKEYLDNSVPAFPQHVLSPVDDLCVSQQREKLRAPPQQALLPPGSGSFLLQLHAEGHMSSIVMLEFK
jgi:hypothetical protein